TSAQLNYPYGVAVDTSGNIFIADIGNNRIRKVFWGIAPETGLVGYWRFENNAIDSSGYGNQGTILGGAGFGTGCYEGSYSLSLDGVDDCVEVSSSSSLDLSGNFTIELWISIGNYSETMNMVNKRDDAYGIQLEYPGVVRFYSAGSHMDSPQNALPTYNSWIHIAAVFTGSEKIIYVNGRAVTTHQFSSPPAINTAKLLIGRHSYSATGQYFNGNIDDVKIYNYARSASEIAADAGVPFSGDSSSFEIWRNVFDPRTESCQIRTSLSAGSSADVNIYDAAGRVITSFTTSSAIFNWDGRDKKSEVVANGVYYISINGGGIKDAKPVAIFKK
ncbi:hypothetical protein FP828_07025, partial [bacterium]|nr:hypothetical protein [bacterium]